MKTTIASLCALVFVTAAASAATVEVRVEGVAVGEGTVNVGVCDRGLDASTCRINQRKPASASSVSFTFDKVPAGNYAVVTFQDKNGNGRLDTFAGVPREPYDMSNGAGAKMAPGFKDALIAIKDGRNRVNLRLAGVMDRFK